MSPRSSTSSRGASLGGRWPDHLRTELVTDALDMTMSVRRPGDGLVLLSDRGCQDTSFALGRRCEEVGIVPSMGSAGDAYDNAMVESFFATLECELIERVRFKRLSAAPARRSCDFIEGFYNPNDCTYLSTTMSPIEFEQQHAVACS